MADAYAGGELLAEVVRSGFVESLHRGSVAVLDASGALVARAGDVTAPVFPRSSNKPLQAVGMVRSGLAVGAADLALVCASHRGQPVHTRRVRAMLASADLPESALRCPPDRAIDPAVTEPASRAHMNCSGKHTGMLLTCVAAGWPLPTYRDPAHPLQAALRAAVEDLAGETVAATGVDGCGAPVFALSLSGLASAFLRLVSAPPGSVERQVADAMRAHPELVSGVDPLAHDTVLMRANPGLLAKGGAEGVQAVAVPGVGAVAMKIDDGAMRPRMPVLAAALRRLGLDAETPPAHVLGGGEVVGEVRSVFE